MDRVWQLKARYMTMETKHTADSIHTWKFRSLVSKAINSELKTNFSLKIVTRFAKTRHNDAFLEIQIFASVSSIYLKLCSVVISMLYCKYFSSYKAR